MYLLGKRFLLHYTSDIPTLHPRGFTPTCVQYWKAANTAVGGLTVTVVGRGESGTTGAVALSPPPHPAAKATTASTAHTRITDNRVIVWKDSWNLARNH